MDYEKKITYLFDDKRNNAGLARLEVRNEMMKLQLNLKMDDATKTGYSEVYIETKDKNRVRLGQVNLLLGQGEFRYMGKADNIQNQRVNVDEVVGLDVCQDGNRIVRGLLSEIEAPKKNGIESIYENHQLVKIFTDEDIYDCVEIEPEDLKHLANTNWGLINNSFLNHGYYAYRHLILGRQHTPYGFGYIIGVPGIYTRMEKNTASMFGFSHFKFSMRNDIRLSQFGYWYKAIDA